MAITLWTARLDRPLLEREEREMRRALPAEQLERTDRLKLLHRRQERLCAYYLLSLAVRCQRGWDALPRILTSPRGKPYFPEHPELSFNLSHTEGAVLVGLSDTPLGVDIERIRPVSPRVMERIAGTDEEETFFRSWVRREARGKLADAGIASMLCPEPPFAEAERYWEVDTFPGFAAGVAARSDGAPEMRLRRALSEGLLPECLTFLGNSL